jgi:hypothetical protein
MGNSYAYCRMEEWHPQYAFNKSRASDDSTKIRPFFSVSTVISNPGLDKFSYVPNLHDSYYIAYD